MERIRLPFYIRRAIEQIKELGGDTIYRVSEMEYTFKIGSRNFVTFMGVSGFMLFKAEESSLVSVNLKEVLGW